MKVCVPAYYAPMLQAWSGYDRIREHVIFFDLVNRQAGSLFVKMWNRLNGRPRELGLHFRGPSAIGSSEIGAWSAAGTCMARRNIAEFLRDGLLAGAISREAGY